MRAPATVNPLGFPLGTLSAARDIPPPDLLARALRNDFSKYRPSYQTVLTRSSQDLCIVLPRERRFAIAALRNGGHAMTDASVTIHGGMAYANHDGVELLGDLYLPQDAKSVPALVAVHGGGWVQGARNAFQYWGPYLAARGIALFAISYRLAVKTKTFPEAVQDVLAGVQFLRGKASAFGIDPQRIGLLGASAGAHLAALAALGGKKFIGGYPNDAFASVDAGVKVLIGVYGIYDVAAMWLNYQIQGGRENNIQKFMGAPPMQDRQAYFDASPISYATFANNHIPVLLVTGTEDDLVDRKQQTEPFALALKQAGFFVRPCIVHGAPHYWMNDPIEEAGSYCAFAAPRLLRFLAEKL
jgi:acetyl esterase/lipase